MCGRHLGPEGSAYLICHDIRGKGHNGTLNCGVGFMECNSSESGRMCLEMSKICDGKADCVDCIDEICCANSSRQKTHPNTGGCNRLCETNIEKDSFNCSLEGTLTKNNSIDWRRQFDGHIDCPDATDEWFYCDEENLPCRINKHLKTWYFATADRSSLQYHMIIQWILGIFALSANFVVIFATATEFVRWLRPRDLKRRPSTARPSAHLLQSKLCNTILVFSLALADFVFGLQMILVAIFEYVLSEQYWKYAHEWQTSLPCTMIAWLASLSFQVSAFTVLALAIFRYNSVVRPFQPLKLKHAFCVFLGIWSVSCLMVSIPLFRFTSASQNYFISSVWMPTNSTIRSSIYNLTHTRRYVGNLQLFSKSPMNATIKSVNEMSWMELEGIVKSINPQFAGWKYYGFYSEFSICIPVLVNSLGQPFWEFSLSVISFNFLLYLMVPIFYWKVYKQSKMRCSSIRRGDVKSAQFKIRKNSREKEDKDMHYLIFLLVITDIICWMPICMLTFIGCLSTKIETDNHISTLLTLLISQLNSIINPFLYSKRLRDFVLKVVFYLKIQLVTSCNKAKLRIGNRELFENTVAEIQMESVSRSLDEQNEPVRIPQHPNIRISTVL